MRYAMATASAVLLCVVLFLAAASAPAAIVTVTYRYDQVGRLVEVDYGRTLSILYTWDANGNLLQRTVLGPQARKLIRAGDAAGDAGTASLSLAPGPLPAVADEASVSAADRAVVPPPGRPMPADSGRRAGGTGPPAH